MQTGHTNLILRKRAASEDIATQPMAKMQKLAQSTTDFECLFLSRLAQELRDHIYDYAAMTETRIGAHVTLKEDTGVKVQAYSRKGLGHTCRQIRQEYSLRLECRINHLLIELANTDASTVMPREIIQYPGPPGMNWRERLALFRNQFMDPPVQLWTTLPDYTSSESPSAKRREACTSKKTSPTRCAFPLAASTTSDASHSPSSATSTCASAR